MTEAEWNACGDPMPLLCFAPLRATERKLRLFAVANCREMMPPSLDHPWSPLVDASEQFADERITAAALAQHTDRFRLRPPPENWFVQDGWRQLNSDLVLNLNDNRSFIWLTATLDLPLFGVVAVWVEHGYPFIPGPAQAILYRCIFGNPFRPVTFAPAWRSETAVALASGIYEKRAFDRLPILADALEEAGCDHPDVLNHLRDPVPHARGCWVVDAVLGKQ